MTPNDLKWLQMCLINQLKSFDWGSGKTQQVFTKSKAHCGLRPGNEHPALPHWDYKGLKSDKNKLTWSDFTTYSKTIYRVYHIEMDKTKWLWGIERSIILLNYGAQWLQEIWTFEFHSPVFSSDFPGLRTFVASMTSTASTTSMASVTSTASFHQNNYLSWWLDHP